MDAHDFLVALSAVLGVAAVTTVLCRRLHLPVVVGYILAGFILGPHVTIPLTVNRQIVQMLSELGIILVMFFLGLEFRVGKLLSLGTTAGITAVLECSLMIWLGFLAGQFFGWTTIESVFAGAIVAISSTTIITKAFEEYDVKGTLRELVVGVLIVEDLVAIVLLTTLTALGSGAGLSAKDIAMTTGKLTVFLMGLMSFGLLLVPRSVRAITRLGSPETTLIASIGFCFAVSLLAHELGYSVALGAFIAGSLIAESGEQLSIQQLIHPVRDIFAAIFFVSVGVLIDPELIIAHWPAVLALTLVVIAGKIVGVTMGAFLTGNGVRTSVQAGMSLAQIGELSFIIAGLGLSLRSTRNFLFPIAVAVSVITTLSTPVLIRVSGPVANYIDRKLPRPIQTFVALYGSWMENVRSEAPELTRQMEIRHYLRLLVLDLALLAAIAIATKVFMAPMAAILEGKLSLDPNVARAIVIMVAIALAVPLTAGVVRVAGRLGLTIAWAALPAAAEGTDDRAAAPRRSLVVTLQFGIVLLAGLPLLAVTQPILGGVYGPALFGLLLAILGIGIWRGAANLEGHVRAGAQTIVEMLIAQARKGRPGRSQSRVRPSSALKQMSEMLPGLGQPTAVKLDKKSSAIGRTLADLNLRGVTGATVLAITRGEEGLLIPTAKEILQAGDVLALAGSQDAIRDATLLLT
ncbi:MAG: cation:proton antiporter [Myxococcales bacterium]|nr:cation:proton antiporter [Myxococcales bacterium]